MVGAPLVGCYLSHGLPGDAEPGARPTPAGRPGPAPLVDGGGTEVPLDAGSALASDAEVPSDEDICESLCEAMREAECLPSGCYESCDSRRVRAAEIGCSAELKGALACLARRPCVSEAEVNCGVENGWPQCLADSRD